MRSAGGWVRATDAFRADFRIAVRTLLKHPGFLVTALLSLTLGISGSVVSFTLVKALFLPAFPVADPATVMMVYSKTQSRTGPLVEYQSTSYLNAIDYRARTTVFSGLTVIVDTVAGLDRAGGEAPALVNLVDPDYFDVLGVKPAFGRSIGRADEAPGAPPVMLVSHKVWTERFGGDPTVVGKTVRLRGQPFSVIGVMPADFHDVGALPPSDVWVPMTVHDQVLVGNIREWFDLRVARVATMVGRLKPGVSPEQAQAEMTSLGRNLERQFPTDNAGRNVMVVPLVHTVVPPRDRAVYARASLVTSIVATVVLLIACANVSNLLLARALHRQREFAIRLSLGASRWQIVRQLLTEGLVLSAAGGGIGLACAYWTRAVVAAVLPGGLPKLDLTFDLRVVLFTVAVAVASTVIFGLAPALRAVDAAATTHPERIDAASPRSRARRWSGLIIAQLGLSLVAVLVAALFIRSLRKADQADLGFDIGQQVVVSADLAALKYSAPRIRNFYDAAAQRLRQLPEVANASTSDTAPLRGSFRRTVFSSDVDTTDPSNGRLAGIISVSPGFFATTGMRLLAGRDFDEHDDANGALVVIANEAAAQSIWRGADPLGKQVRLLLQSPNVTVVGLVNTVTYQGIGESPQPILYVPLKQRPSAQGFLYVRTRGAPSASVASIRTAVMSVEPNLPVLRVTLGEDLRRDLLALRRIGAQSLLVFGGLALVLASLGTYGVMSYAIERRRKEIAIRMAIGSSRGVLLRQILTNCLLTIGMGVVAGMLVAVPATGVIGALLYGVGAFDPVAVGGSVAVLFGAGLLACALPAWRAMHVEPRAALYSE